LHDEYTVYLSFRACYVEFLSSGKFPGTAWREFKAARRPMPFSCYFWVPEVDPPNGVSLTARRRLVVYPV